MRRALRCWPRLLGWALITWLTAERAVEAQESTLATHKAALALERAKGAEDCSDEPTLARAVENVLGRALFSAANDGEKPSLHVTARIAPRPADTGFGAQITLRAASGEVLGERALENESASCHALDEYLALVIAMMVDVSVQRMEARVPRPPEPRVALSVGGEASYGRVPRLGLEPVVRTFLRAGASWLQLSLSAFATFQALSTREPGAQLRMYGGELLACPALMRGTRLQFLLCAGSAAGIVQARGTGSDINKERLRAHMSVDARAIVRITVRRRWFIDLSGWGGAAILRDRFTFRSDTGEHHLLFAAPIAVAGGGLSLGAWLP